MDLKNQIELELYFADHFDTILFPVLADIYFNQEDYRRARKVCNIGLGYHENDAAGRFVLAKVEKAEGNLKDAEKERDVKQSPNPTDLKSSLATAYVSNPSLLAIVERLDANQRTRLWDYWLTHKDGLVRAYYNGQEVVIEAQLLIEEMRHMESKSK